jgi:hypothetical protein
MRRPCGVRRQLSSKPEPYPERMGVDTAGIRGKVDAHYPGRSAGLPMSATAVARRWEGSAEVSRGHSRFLDRTEGLNVKCGQGDRTFDDHRRSRQKG